MKSLSLLIIAIIFLSIPLQAQDELKSLRLSLNFTKSNESGELKAKARTRVGRRYENVKDLQLRFYRISMSTDELIGTAESDMNGEATINVNEDLLQLVDSSGYVEFAVAVETQEGFEDEREQISLAPGDLKLNVEIMDSVASVKMSLYNSFLNEAVEDAELRFYVKRYFSPLWLTELEFTDSEGLYEIELPEKIPGDIDGNIVIGVVVESDEMGMLRREEIIPFGEAYTPDTSFDERSMWAPRDKTPLWLLIFPNLIIFGVWGTLIFLVHKLYVIYRS